MWKTCQVLEEGKSPDISCTGRNRQEEKFYKRHRSVLEEVAKRIPPPTPLCAPVDQDTYKQPVERGPCSRMWGQEIPVHVENGKDRRSLAGPRREFVFDAPTMLRFNAPCSSSTPFELSERIKPSWLLCAGERMLHIQKDWNDIFHPTSSKLPQGRVAKLVERKVELEVCRMR